MVLLLTYTFTLGDSGNTSTTRDQITGLKTTDKIIFGGYGITGLTSGSNLASSASSLTTKEIYVDQVNNRIVIETAVDGSTTEEIAIPSSVGKAAFTYNYGADSVVGTADDYLTVGFAPLTKTNDGLGKLTLVGNTVADIAVVITTNGSPTVGGDAVTGGIVRTLDASAVTGGAVSVTGSTGADSIIGTALADTIQGNAGADIINGGLGNDSYVYATATSDTGVAGGTSGAISTTALDVITVTAGDTISLIASLGTDAGYDTVTRYTAANASALTVVAGTVAITTGVYDSTAGTFTPGNTSPNAELLSWASADGTTADQSIILVGTATVIDTMLNGVLTIEQLAKRLKVSLFMARLAKKKEKHLL
jgi:hypothetical protein